MGIACIPLLMEADPLAEAIFEVHDVIAGTNMGTLMASIKHNSATDKKGLFALRVIHLAATNVDCVRDVYSSVAAPQD